MAYLEYRERLPVWSSPGIPFPPAKFSGEADQLKYAAKVVSGALDYKIRLDKQILPPGKLRPIKRDKV
jgi:Choline/Carnitine o-acyltransferase